MVTWCPLLGTIKNFDEKKSKVANSYAGSGRKLAMTFLKTVYCGSFLFIQLDGVKHGERSYACEKNH